MNAKDTARTMKDLATYGMAAKIVYTRAWWNPMRWIKGKEHQQRIDLNAPRKRRI
jgi:hypothetical protein